MAEIAANNEMIETYDLSLIMSRLNLGWTPQFPSYEEVFPSQWANNTEVETRHKQIMQRIQNWPYDHNNEVAIHIPLSLYYPGVIRLEELSDSKSP